MYLKRDARAVSRDGIGTKMLVEKPAMVAPPVAVFHEGYVPPPPGPKFEVKIRKVVLSSRDTQFIDHHCHLSAGDSSVKTSSSISPNFKAHLSEYMFERFSKISLATLAELTTKTCSLKSLKCTISDPRKVINYHYRWDFWGEIRHTILLTPGLICEPVMALWKVQEVT